MIGSACDGQGSIGTGTACKSARHTTRSLVRRSDARVSAAKGNESHGDFGLLSAKN